MHQINCEPSRRQQMLTFVMHHEREQYFVRWSVFLAQAAAPPPPPGRGSVFVSRCFSLVSCKPGVLQM